jgi:hypothetical protein
MLFTGNISPSREDIVTFRNGQENTIQVRKNGIGIRAASDPSPICYYDHFHSIPLDSKKR